LKTFNENVLDKYTSQMKKFLGKITVLVYITMFESSGSPSESDDDSDSNRSGSARSLCSFFI